MMSNIICTFRVCVMRHYCNIQQCRHILSHRNRIDSHCLQIEVQSVMLNHSVAEHLPQDVAAELCQCGIDEQVLPLQGLRQRAARTGIFLLYLCVFHHSGDDFQRADSFV